MSMLTVAADYATAFLAQPPNPGPQPPPGLENFGNSLISWIKWGVLVAGMVGILASAIMVIVGRRGRNEVAVQGFMGVGYGLVGLAIASVAAVLVGAFAL
ncbi:hypothetical protein [Prauserella endophytica]|uniref:DUF4190 domain-containing protein n=1 Tax=Prauserella endophytica TaxID=1592324 RepID=A0ABY2RUX6_9PSEU|nr:hypothetical protein [Prauserella endophytica]TKG61513.1 hypothetical protein FCN18_33270 [Prauserella endophytica]